MSGPLVGPVLVVGGNGAVGALFTKAFIQAGVAVTVLDVQAGPAGASEQVLTGDVLHPGEAINSALRSAAIVILAVPESVAIKALPLILPQLGPGTLLVDTLSVKTPYATALAGCTGPAEAVGVNPMFAPDLGFAGRSVIAVPYLPGERSAALLQFITDLGAGLVVMDADAHDRACAALQAATHAAILAFGLTLRAVEHDFVALESVSPPPHRTLLALLARIVVAEPEVYRDIQAANPYAAGMRTHLAESLRELDAVIATGDPAAFASLTAGLKPLLGNRADDYARMCAALFASPALKS